MSPPRKITQRERESGMIRTDTTWLKNGEMVESKFEVKSVTRTGCTG
jgi:hypothetical protein